MNNKNKDKRTDVQQTYAPRKILKTGQNELHALFSLFSDARLKQVFRFASVGASGVLLVLFLTWIFTEYIGLFYLLSAALAMQISVFWAFALNTKITFRYKFKKSDNLFPALGKYQLVALGGITINLALLFAFTTFLNIFYIISELMAIIVAFGFRYLMSLRFVWRNQVAS
ncbi:MAG: GtrA family protein [Halobacteriota archaeon]|jgi:dolichol-phosphate mannosyltransferase